MRIGHLTNKEYCCFMDAVQFIKTIYLGDRCITGINIDSEHMSVKIQVDVISRIRSNDGNWNFYTDEDIPNGKIVFNGCKKFILDSQGVIPSDFIDISEISKIENEEYKIVFDASQYDFYQKKHIPITIQIVFSEVYIEDDVGSIIRI